MRLYSRAGATAIADQGTGKVYEGKDGAFDMPEALALAQHAFHAGGKPLWETDIERQNRDAAENLELARSPEALYEAVQQIVGAAQAFRAPEPKAAARPEPAKAAVKAPAGK